MDFPEAKHRDGKKVSSPSSPALPQISVRQAGGFTSRPSPHPPAYVLLDLARGHASYLGSQVQPARSGPGARNERLGQGHSGEAQEGLGEYR